jgi:hypothetical protein
MKAAMNKLLREQYEARKKLQDEERRTTTQLRGKNEKASEVLREKRNLAVFALNETQEECVPLTEATLLYAQAWNQSFAEDVLTRLPRELRDMVYTYLWTTESLESTNLFLAQDPECMRIQTRPYIIDSAYVGGEMAAEILELFYQLTSGVAGACHLEWPEQVRGVIHHDVAGLGLIAANLLRALYIRLDLEFLTTHGTRRFDVSRLEYFLARLYDIKKKEGFKLHFELQQHRIRLKQWEQGFRVLAPICRVFEAAGAEVHTSWTYRDEG